MAKRQRKYKLIVDDIFGSTVTVENLSIDFDIEKSIMANVCQGSITIYNLGELTRNRIYKDLYQTSIENMRSVEFFAGYESDSELSRVFKGTIQRCYSYRQGVDFMTVIEVNSGSDYLANSYVTDTIPEGTLVKDAIADFCQRIVPGGNRYIGNFEGTFRRATSTAEKADSLIKAYTSGKFFIDDGNVFCLKDDEYIDGIINVIDSDSGLLGSPQREEIFLTFDIIFEPRILMGQIIELRSSTIRFFNGQYKVVGFHHVGSISKSICGTAKTTVRVNISDTSLLKRVQSY